MVGNSNLLFVFILISSALSQQPTQCPRVIGEPGCVCKWRDEVINLTSIAYDDGSESFKVTHGDYRYFYNPCYSFSVDVKSGACSKSKEMAGCQQYTKGDNVDGHGLGKLDTETIFKNPDGSYYLNYTNGDGNRRIKVNLICQNHPSTELSTERDDGHQLEYVFYLSSPAACPSKQSSSHHEGYKSIIGPIGIGIIFFALFCFILYFIIGGLIMKFKMQAKGTDIIPQKRFWFGLPLLIKDGVLFIFSPLFRKNYKPIL